MTVKELEHQILSLTFPEKAEILQLLLRDFTAFWTANAQSSNGLIKDREQNESLKQSMEQKLSVDEFDALADQLADEFAEMVGDPMPALSDYAISRAGIYEDHP